ncbi:hypothetical protein FH972_009035 [Carpinus fangiana]|uniref:DRBM domain-containing protein n=1 Tax=Carpinus fangiana TaxID=176857 RepID=A0A5N6R0P1_9ROSI|nr:hypothetical protein FH972_009035 [Carpinus fangiana]
MRRRLAALVINQMLNPRLMRACQMRRSRYESLNRILNFPLRYLYKETAQIVSLTHGRNPTRILEHLTYKNLLQQYTKRRCIPLPIYKTINEGSQGALQFRATILVDGGSYTSLNTSSDREAAERNAAKLALEGISQKIKDEVRRLICENKVPCKSTLDAFAVKMNLEMPTYNTINQMQKRLPPFISSLVFNGVSYIGEAGRNKGQAEILAARAVILSLLGSFDPGTLLFEMSKHDVEFQPALLRKAKFYAALYTVKDTCYCQMSVVSQGRSIGQISAIPQGVYVAQPLGQPLGEGPSSTKKRRKNKKKSNKKLRSDTQ